MLEAIQNLLNPQAPYPQRLVGLGWAAGLAVLIQLPHLGLAWWLLPDLRGLGMRGVWVLGTLGLLVLGVTEALKVKNRHPARKLGVLQSAFWDGFALGALLLLALFALRMGFGGWAFGLAGVGLGYWGLGWARLAVGLKQL